MKTIIAFLHVIVMLLTFGAAAYADDDTITMEQAMRTAFHFVGLEEDDASFMKGHRGYDNGRPFFEISFIVNGTEYEMDVDAGNGKVSDFRSNNL